jgi:hypothetical protein
VTILARSRGPPVSVRPVRSARWRRQPRRALRSPTRPRLHGAPRRSWRKRRCSSASATSGSRSSCNFSRRRAASASSASRTRRTDPRDAAPSRCGRAISSGCGRRSSARPSSRRRLVSSGALREPTAGARQACARARCAAAASTSAASRSPPSADPSSGSTACSGWGMSPMTLPASLTTPATLPREPFTSSA